MRAGRLNTRVHLEQPVKVPNGSGGTSTSYQRQFTRRANIRIKSLSAADEQAGPNGYATAVTFQCTMRADVKTKTIKPNWRIQLDDGRKFDIVSGGAPVSGVAFVSLILKEQIE